MKKTYQRLICVFLSVLLLLAALPLTVYAEGTAYSVGTFEELNDAVSAINSAGADNYEIRLTADITSTMGGISFSNAGSVVTIIGNGHSFTCPQGQNVQAWNGATVNLGDGETTLTLIGGVNNDNPGLVYVNGASSTCNMYDLVTLKDNEGQNYFGGGVKVDGGTFHMYGGTIQNCGINGGAVCYGGGVAVINGGTFIMDNGTITRCYALSDYVDDEDPYRCFTAQGGGVFVTAGSTFTMNGGTISNCEATNFGGGISVDVSKSETSSGFGYLKSKATINGGTISGNTAGDGAGVFASGFFYASAHAFSWNPSAVGNPSNPGVYINGGSIENNSTDGMGGGILTVGMRTPTRIHNAEITSNTAGSGAGIAVYYYWVNPDIDGCTISNNTADANGGGIALLNNTVGTVLKNTTITGNTSGARGAGVYYDANSNLNISGANTIQNNTFDGKLNNLNVLSLEKPVYVTGDLTGSQIGLSDPTLWDDGKADIALDAVSTERLTDGYKANNGTLIPADAFTSDHESWVVDYGEIKTEQVEVGETYTYTARNYDAVSRTTGSQLARGTLIDVVAKTTFSQGGRASNTTELYNELTERYTEEYTKTDTDNYYDPASGSTIVVSKSGNNVLVYVNGAYYLFAGVSYQQYVDEGHFALVFLTGYLDNAEFSDDYTENPVTLDEPIDEDETVYEFNDIGHIISKNVIVKSSEVVDIQYDTVTTDYSNEVRLVRKTTVDYHINNKTIADAKYDGNDLFTSYVVEATGEPITIGETIKAFYAIPEITPTRQNSCPYIFKGWYYDKANDNDDNPVTFGTDEYIAGRDIYAHWITVGNVEQDPKDENELPAGETAYGGFDLAGVQVRNSIIDTNYDYERKPGGLRFVTSLSMDVVDAINEIQDNNIAYGYVAATREDWIHYHQHYGDKLQYVSATANGINTADSEIPRDYFAFATNIDCTSKKTNTAVVLPEDHRNYRDYLLYTLVITYEGDDGSGYGRNVLARPYIKYTDANGLERVAYSEYRGSNVLGGCYTSYNAVAQQQEG